MKNKNFIIIILITFISIIFTNCIQNILQKPKKELNPLILLAAAASTSNRTATSNFEQFTPNLANWDTFKAKPFATGSTNTGHDPDGVGWLTKTSWDNAKWNGTPYDPSKMTRAQFTSAICPSGDQIRGIREVFYANRPFANNRNPTKAEVDEWHRIALNHVRALVGYTTEDRKVKKDQCMFIRAQWGEERNGSTKWDSKYPGVTDSAYGPCTGKTNPHCGATFIPDAGDQSAYLPSGQSVCTEQAGAEGVTSAPKSNIPWSIKWSRAFCAYLGSEGFWGGHVGPFFHREKFGFAFWDMESGNNNSNASLRAKWTGKLMDNLYTNPSP